MPGPVQSDIVVGFNETVTGGRALVGMFGFRKCVVVKYLRWTERCYAHLVGCKA